MKVSIEQELIPFTVPDYVSGKRKVRPRQEGFGEGLTFHLSDLDSMTLDKLCEEFKREVFKKAGKEMLPTVG